MSCNSSYAVFFRFIKLDSDNNIDVRGIFSSECYKAWLSTRAGLPKCPEESFRKAITAHCKGVDGRRPFPREIEAAILVEIRKKQVWECFKDCPLGIGRRGYRAQGYWEKRNQEKNNKASTPLKTKISPTKASPSKKRKIEDVSYSDLLLIQEFEPENEDELIINLNNVNNKVSRKCDSPDISMNRNKNYATYHPLKKEPDFLDHYITDFMSASCILSDAKTASYVSPSIDDLRKQSSFMLLQNLLEAPTEEYLPRGPVHPEDIWTTNWGKELLL